MSDIHVLYGRRDGGIIYKRYAFHYIVPAEYRVADAAQDPEVAGFTSAVPNITDFAHPEDAGQTELDAIKEGAVIEVQVTLPYHYTESGSSVLARVRTRYAELEQQHINNYRARYNHYLDNYAST